MRATRQRQQWPVEHRLKLAAAASVELKKTFRIQAVERIEKVCVSKVEKISEFLKYLPVSLS